MSLPRGLDELAGRRAARWIRESTAGQFDAFGPDAQREQQDRAIERWGLVDVGLTWHVAHSGRTVASTPAFGEMLAAAGRDFDVLVVGYVSRFARDLRTAVNARHDLHAAGACILFADERILTSDEERWDEWAREAVEAESYSRKLGRRIREGYAAKRRRGDPGGRPPVGFVRAGRPPRLVPTDQGDAVDRVRRAYAAAAAGAPDRHVATAVGLPIDTVRGILTNPIYVGRLRDGTVASVQPVIDVATWQRVQELRAERRTRGGKPETVRAYALPMLRCAGCGVRLIGDSGRYRHRQPCAPFTAARRRLAYRNRLVRTLGSSYPAELYEGALGQALEQVTLQPADLAAIATLEAQPVPDRLDLRRIEAERQRALSRYAVDRDVARLEEAMLALDQDERSLTEVDPGAADGPSWSEVLPWLQDLAGLWHEALPSERREVAEQLFARVDALGCRELVVTPTAAAIAHGLVAGVQRLTVVGATGFGPVTVRFRTPPRLAQVISA